MRNLSASAGFVLAAAVLCALPMLGQGQCLLQLAVTSSSVINFGGSTSEPIRGPITLDDSSALSLDGNIALHLPGSGACPNSASSLLDDIQSSTIQAQKGNQLALLPAELSSKVRPSPSQWSFFSSRGPFGA